MKNYGVDHYFKLKANRDKLDIAMINKYGVANTSHCPEHNLRKSNTLKNNALTKNSKYQSWLHKIQKKWENKSQSDLDGIRDMRDNTMQSKYGDINYNIHQMQNTLYETYGVSNASQIAWVAKKISKTWASKTIHDLELINDKRTKTMFINHGYRHIMYNPEMKQHIINRGIKTKQSRGSILLDGQISDYQLYRRRVYHYTNISLQLKYNKEQLDTRGLCGVDGAMQLDHKYSIKQGFVDNIPPYIIGSYHNLDLISWEENSLKRDGCTITIDALIHNGSK
jgi:hypothetical protein